MRLWCDPGSTTSDDVTNDLPGLLSECHGSYIFGFRLIEEVTNTLIILLFCLMWFCSKDLFLSMHRKHIFLWLYFYENACNAAHGFAVIFIIYFVNMYLTCYATEIFFVLFFCSPMNVYLLL